MDAMTLFRAEGRAQEALAKVSDGFDNFISRVGLNNDNALSAGTYTFNLLTRNRIKLEQAYRGSWVAGTVVDAVAEDMTRAGITITTNESKDDLNDFKNKESDLQIWTSLCLLVKWGRLYGGAIAVLQIDGQDPATPLNLDSVTEGDFLGLVVYDRWAINPDLTQVIKSGPNMGLPKYYDIVNSPANNGAQPTPEGYVRVHHSRVIRFTGIDLPYFQAITEMMWGESVLERLWDRLISFDNATMSSASLVDRANLRAIGIEGLREIMAAGGDAQKGLEAQFEAMRIYQVNEGLTLMDKNDEYQSTAYTFTGLSDILLQFGQQISGACGIPLVRFFGQSPAGLNSTGESDLRMYYDNINAQQNAKLRTGLSLLIAVMWRSTFGVPEPKDLQFAFTPLWQMSATDKAANGQTITNTVTAAYEAGLTSRASSLKDLKQTAPETGLFGNITDEEIKEAEEEPPPMPDTQVPEEKSESDPEKKSALDSIKSWLTRKKA